MRVSMDTQIDARLLSLLSDQPRFAASPSVACDLEEERRIPELPIEEVPAQGGN